MLIGKQGRRMAWRKGMRRKEEKDVLPAVEACMLRKERSRAELSEKLPFA
jgi:hypothetical protein